MAYSYDDREGETRQEPPRRPPKKDDNDFGSWAIIAILFAVAWPVGLVVLLAKLFGGDTKRKPVSRQNPGLSQQNPAPSRPRTGTASSTRKKVTKTPQYSAKGANTMKIVGLVLLFAGLVSMVQGVGAAAGVLSWSLLAELFPTMGLAAGGLGLVIGSASMTRRARRFGKYLACAHGQDAVSLKKLADTAEVPQRKVEGDLEIMIEKGLWGKNAYVDLSSDMLFRSPEAAEAYFAPRQTAQEPAPAEQGYSGILREIRRANDRIADPVLSQKIDRLEEVAGKIFRIIEKEPAKKGKAGTFLNYYLPTTQKLLNSYAEFEEAGVSGENLNQAKAKSRAPWTASWRALSGSWMSCTAPTPWTSTAISGSWKPCSAGTAPPWPTISAWAARRYSSRTNEGETPCETNFCFDFSAVYDLFPFCLRQKAGGPHARQPVLRQYRDR